MIWVNDVDLYLLNVSNPSRSAVHNLPEEMSLGPRSAGVILLLTTLTESSPAVPHLLGHSKFKSSRACREIYCPFQQISCLLIRI